MTRSTHRKQFVVGVAAGALLAAVAGSAAAETNEVRFAQQFGLLYLPMHVVVDHKLVQKHAKKLGLPEPKVTMHRFSGGAAVNKALIAGNVDFAAGGIGPLLKLWGRTQGRQNVKAMTNMADMPLKLNTNDPNVKTIDDYLTVKNHKIATPAAKVSIQAVTLQMAALKRWGKYDKLDHLVISMKHPAAMAALISGGQSVKSHFATLPTSFLELKSGKVHTVLTSYDVLGGQHSVLAMYNTEQWKKAHPKMYQAVVNAYDEAFKWIAANPEEGAKLFIRFTKSKLSPEDVVAMMTDKSEIEYSQVPKLTMKYAKFLNSIGDIPMPKSWKDYYWENNHKFPGS